jgi:hypothetical protein
MNERDKQKGGQPEASEEELDWEGTSEDKPPEPAAARPKRDSFIPLPPGFRQRKARESSSSGLEWSGKAPPGEPASPLRPPSRPPERGPSGEKPATAPAARTEPVARAAPAVEAPRPSAPAPKPPAAVASPPRGATRAAERVVPLETRAIQDASTPPEGKPSAAPRSHTPALGLEPAHQPQLIYSQAGNPTAEMPIVYRERAYFVDSLLGDDELKDSLLKELGSLQEELRGWEQVKYVQLALFDHKFQRQPNGPPLATLSWKDWHSEPELWVRGVRHSGPPVADAADSKPDWDLNLDAHGPSTERGGVARVQQVRASDAELAEPVLPAAIQRPRPSAPPRPKPERPSTSAPLELTIADAPFSDEPFTDAPLADTPPVAERPRRVSTKPPPAPSLGQRRSGAPLEPELIEAVPESLEPDSLDDGAVLSERDDGQRPEHTPQLGFPAPAAADELDMDDSSPMPLVRRRTSMPAPHVELGDAEDPDFARPRGGPDAAADFARPETPPPGSGLEEDPIPLVSLKPSRPASPSVARTTAGSVGRRADNDELLGVLFERMHELLFAPGIMEGADYVLAVLAEAIPCEGAIIHVFDRDDHSFVVLAARGPNSERILLSRTPESEPRLKAVLRREGALPSDAPDAGPAHRREVGGASLWQRLGITVEHSLCGPALHERGHIGLIELANPRGGGPFHESELNALDYICEQFADFVAQRPIVFE